MAQMGGGSNLLVQGRVFGDPVVGVAESPPAQLLKWIGNKHRFAIAIASHLPARFGGYFEPFLGGGAVLAAVAPRRGFASDAFGPLMEIWSALQKTRDDLKRWYLDRWNEYSRGDRTRRYEEIRDRYNSAPNGPDLLFLCRACYGGVVRFRKVDGGMSTPCGAHMPIHPETFARRVDAWAGRIAGTEFAVLDFRDAMSRAGAGDVVYCDPPYSYSQGILYGAQGFALGDLLSAIADCKRRGVFVLLSIDGTKRSGNLLCDLPIPPGLFEREILLNGGRSMLKRFQMKGRSLSSHEISDRLLLTY